jgi:GTP-binding protein HflX
LSESNGKTRLIENELIPVQETAIVARLCLPNQSDDEVSESLEEIQALAWTAGANVLRTFVQYRPEPCPATLLGKGKVKEIASAVEELSAGIAIIDSELTPTQAANLEEAWGCKVVDRTQLILDIFAQRAKTNEGKIQVELAQLEYMLPRLTGLRSKMMRQQGGIGVRGPGEQKLEVDRRVVRDRMIRLKDNLKQVRKRREIQRRRRADGGIATVALVGYTNAGKSSILRALSGADVFVEDKLFATLDPTSRRCTLPSRREVVFTDTVGFIRNLPHSLVAAFRATLEEINEADLLLMVLDAAHPAMEEHVKAVRAVLDEIGSTEKQILKVFNKSDVANPDRLHALLAQNPNSVAISAHTREGLDALLQTIDERLALTRNRVLLRIPQSRAGLVSRLYDAGCVVSQEYEGDSILVQADMDAELQGQYLEFVA